MTATLAQPALAQALTLATTLADGKSPIPVLGCVRIDLAPAGVTITASNMTTWVTATVAAEGSVAWSGCVGMAELAAFVRSLPASESVTLSATGERLTVAAAGARGRFAVLPAANFPVAMDADREAVRFTLPAA